MMALAGCRPGQEQEDGGAAQQRKNRHAGDRRQNEPGDQGPRRDTVEQLGMPADPHTCHDPESGNHPHRHPRRRLPHQPHGDQAEGDGERQVHDPDGDAEGDGLGGLAVHLEQADASQASTVETIEPTSAEMTLATSRSRPSGSSVPVARASNLPSRAAIAAPTRPTTSVRCEVNGAAPGIPVPKSRRSTTSAAAGR